MTARYTALRSILRSLLILALLFCSAAGARAQKDVEPLQPAGSGTELDPYLISEPGHLVWIKGGKNQNNTTAASETITAAERLSAHYKMVGDIDLGGQDFGYPIGKGGTANDVDQPAAFSGMFEGDGHVIAGLTFNWPKTGVVSFGLFGYLTGKVENLVIDRSQMVYTGDDGATIGNDIKLGFLAGAVGRGATINNIVVTNSRISDGGKTVKLKGAFFGGVVGDIAFTYEGYKAMTLYDPVSITNVYAQVDFDLAKLEPNSNSQAHQMNVGGIVGRIRRGAYDEADPSKNIVENKSFPINSFFTGKINAPRAMVSPVFGSARADGGLDEKGMKPQYSGQFNPRAATDNGTTTEPTKFQLLPEDYSDKTFFKDYYIWDNLGKTSYAQGEEPGFKLVTDEFPAQTYPVSEDKYNSSANIRALANSGFSRSTAVGMRGYQGVNRGTYVSDADYASTLSAINAGLPNKLNWVETSMGMRLYPKQDVKIHSITQPSQADENEHNRFDFTAHVFGPSGTNEISHNYHYAWYSLQSPSSQPQFIANTKTPTLSCLANNGYLKVVLLDADDNPILDNDAEVYYIYKVESNFNLDVEVSDAMPYHVTINFTDAQGRNLGGAVGVEAELLKAADGSKLKDWTTNYPGYEFDIPYTDFEAQLSVTLTALDPDIHGHATFLQTLNNYLKLGGTIDDSKIPQEINISVTDKNGQAVELDGIKYSWFITKNSLEKGGTPYPNAKGEETAAQFQLPISLTYEGRYLNVVAKHEDLLEDFDVNFTIIKTGLEPGQYQRYLYLNTTSGYRYPEFTDLTQPGDNQQTVKISIFDNFKGVPASFFGIDKVLTIRNRYRKPDGSLASIKDQTEKYVVDGVKLEEKTDADGAYYLLTLPYPTLEPISPRLTFTDKFGNEKYTTGDCDEFNPQTIPTLEQGSNPKIVNVVLTAGSYIEEVHIEGTGANAKEVRTKNLGTSSKKEEIVNPITLSHHTGMVFNWKLVDRLTGNTLRLEDYVDLSNDNMTATFRSYSSSFDLRCTVIDYYGNERTLTYASDSYPITLAKSKADPDRNYYLAHTPEGATDATPGLPSGYEVVNWKITGIDGKPVEAKNLAAGENEIILSNDNLTANPGNAFIDRILIANLKDPSGYDISVREIIPAEKFTTTQDQATNVYSPLVNGAAYQATDYTSAESAADHTVARATSSISVKWQVLYDDGYDEIATETAQTDPNITPNPSFTLNPALPYHVSRPNQNATYILIASDAYGEYKSSIRHLVHTTEISVTRTDNTLTATIDGKTPEEAAAEGTWAWWGTNASLEDDISKYYQQKDADKNPITTNTLELNKDNEAYTNFIAVWTSNDKQVVLRGFYSMSNVIYVYDADTTRKYNAARYESILNTYPNGDDRNDGRTPNRAVRTMNRAYQLLSPDYSKENNTVVVMGDLWDPAYLRVNNVTSTNHGNYQKGDYSKNSTVTGTYGSITDGTIRMISSGSEGSGNIEGLLYLGGVTEYRDITFAGLKGLEGLGKSPSSQLYLYCRLHDLTIGRNVKIEKYDIFGAGESGLYDAASPKITITAGMHRYDGELSYAGNSQPDRTTITIQSGCWGRIISSARNDKAPNTNSHNIFGSPDAPHRVEVIVQIQHDESSPLNEYTPDRDASNQFKYDIGLLAGGQTDGTIYVDSRQLLQSGKIGRFISGNISYGRKTYTAADEANGEIFPSDSFFGSTTLTIEGGEIGELVGGTLGRWDLGDAEVKEGRETENCEAYFYGRSTLNILGGKINNNIYGAGAGGVVGLCNLSQMYKDDYDANWNPIKVMQPVGSVTEHTLDTKIPYLDDNDKDANGKPRLKYGDFQKAYGHMPTMQIYPRDKTGKIISEDMETLDLAHSVCVVNIEGGEINGQVYGGGYGFSKNIKVEKALTQAGHLFGDSHVNISGGVIHGNVYGGGAGTDQYYKDWLKKAYDDVLQAKYDAAYAAYIEKVKKEEYDRVLAENEGKPDAEDKATKAANDKAEKQATKDAAKAAGEAAKKNEENIAEANTAKENAKTKAWNDFSSLANVYGQTNVSITGGIIEGKVYAGSQGIVGFPLMATLHGDTNLEISNATLADNKEVIPIINDNIYGGSEIGRITGNTRVAINGGAIGNCIFGGSEGIETAGQETIAIIDGNTQVSIGGGTYFTQEHIDKITDYNQIDASSRTFNIYGGGYRNCVVYGNTFVNISKSLFSTYSSLLEGRTYWECANDESYRKFSVYGAGRGILTDIVGDTNLTIDLPTGISVGSYNPNKPQNVIANQQFFMICGGGFAGNVLGNTHLTLNGNIFANRVYGGGMYGRVEGTTNTNIYGGAYYSVYGGGLLGDIKQGANLFIGNQLDSSGSMAANTMATKNSNIVIYENVYGGNDVGGIVGYKQAMGRVVQKADGTKETVFDRTLDPEDPNVQKDLNDGKVEFIYWHEGWNNPATPTYNVRWFSKDNDGNIIKAPQTYPYTIHTSDERYGVDLRIYGGTILGDVFGAGNGNHMGYYVPNKAQSEHNAPGEITRVKYHEGPAYLYRFNKFDAEHCYDANNPNTYRLTNDKDKEDWAIYEYRPRTLHVNMHIGGNSENDRVKIGGNVYGGGYACTIGDYNPLKDPLVDPDRFIGGGSLKMNFGSHVRVDNGVYMGSRGEIVGKQTVIGDADEYSETTINSDYDYHYYDPNSKTYKLGFPNTVEGRNRFHAYMKLIDMDAKVQLTFMDNPYQDPDNPYNELTDIPAFDPEKPYQFQANDIVWESFFAGGARGSMTYEPKPLKDASGNNLKDKDGNDLYPIAYHYILPEGLTVKTRVVGGSEDAVVNFYKYADDYKSFNDIEPWFTYHGGIVYEENTGQDKHYGGAQVTWHSAPAGTDPDEIVVGDESPRGSRVVMKLDVRCKFDPQLAVAHNANWVDYQAQPGHDGEVEDDGDQYYGGLVYGGCYQSGITNGSVEVICNNTLLGNDRFQSDDYRDYLKWSSLRRNVGRVYGGGFGTQTKIWGNTKVELKGRTDADGNQIDGFRGFNVFGGGMKGDVIGKTEINISGRTFVYNAVYGGGMEGDVGLSSEAYFETDANGNPTTINKYNDLSAGGSNITVTGGGIDRIYGGGFMGNVHGGSHITVRDEAPVRLMVGSIFGGNDVCGEVIEPEPTAANPNPTSSYIDISEKPSAAKKDYIGSQLSTLAGESGLYYAGFPLIGTVYGAGNGNMSDYVDGVEIDKASHQYMAGKIHIANGNKADYTVYDFSKMRIRQGLPDLNSSDIKITGGTIINVYAGGSMCTTKNSNHVLVNYNDTVARAAFTGEGDKMTWGVLRLFEDLQQSEVTEKIADKNNGNYTRFSHNIYRVFGGNNLMDMDIQPNLELKKGYLFSVYSGGNFGQMNYCAPAPSTPSTASALSSSSASSTSSTSSSPRGLSLTINSPDIRIQSVYGGGRVGDIRALDELGQPVVFTGENEYGATLNILDGIIGDVYGGNNVAGTVYNGTNVNIHGAISGNVYGSGNGNYVYYYNYNGSRVLFPGTKQEQKIVDPTTISEGYHRGYGGRFFILPPKAAYGEGANAVYYGNSNEEKILAINRYRPNVEKAYLNIEGEAPTAAVGTEGQPGYKPATPGSVVYVLGNVYCGGNSSTVLYNPKKLTGDIKFRIGNYVTLGGVFLGSNGESLANSTNITYLSTLNGIDMKDPNRVASNAVLGDKSKLYYNDLEAHDISLYPNLLSLYMRAAEVTALPDELILAPDAVEAYIGDFTVGGNVGSMMTDKKIDLTLPEQLTIFGRIVGGCYNSRVEYNDAIALGGMTKPLAQKTDAAGNPVTDAAGKPVYETNKLDLKIKSKFRPWRLVYDDVEHKVNLVNDRVNLDDEYVADDKVVAGTQYRYSEGRCNIYGGCYTSGKTVGDIQIDLYSDMLGRYESPDWVPSEGGKPVFLDSHKRAMQIDRDLLFNNARLRRSAYGLTGAGYGPLSEVQGNVLLRMLPTAKADGSTSTAEFHPTVGTIFGGSHDGKHIGNSTTEVRDGMVLSNLYAGSRAAYKYGSSEVVVGYPVYYKVKKGMSGTFTLDRADTHSYVAQAKNEADKTFTADNGKTYNFLNHDGTEVIKQTANYREGDIVAANVAAQIIAYKPYDNTVTAKTTPEEILDQCFDEIKTLPGDFTPNPATGYKAITWDDISINIGDNSNMNNPSAKFYGGGGIYGGGHALNESTKAYSGINTQLTFDLAIDSINNVTVAGYRKRFDDSYRIFGGNSTIVIGDNPENSDYSKTWDKATRQYSGKTDGGNVIRDHISIGTGHYVEQALETGVDANGEPKEDKIGTYLFVANASNDGSGRFVHQKSGPAEDGKRYFKMETDGGIYGDGRRTFVEKFRAVDISGYGYADYNPQEPKLINTFQRIDLVSLTDCCLQLQGAQDYATNTIDATYYSIARIGELRMNSSLTGAIEPSVEDGENLGNMKLDIPRSRNYMGFFKNVHFVGSMFSNVNFTDKYRSNSGVEDDTYNYKSRKEKYIDDYEKGGKQDIAEFKKRNLGTSPNMVGINNGYTLKLQNTFTTNVISQDNGGGSNPSTPTDDPDNGYTNSMLSQTVKDNIYYGPIVGVVEVKLLTVQQDEGGGYIYAFNKHKPNTAGTPSHTFLEDTGNFVFAASVYGTENSNGGNNSAGGNTTANYIIDDCYPQGYYDHEHNATDEEVHYWFVQGNKYFFNTTLTGYTYNNPIDFYLSNSDALILLSGVQPTVKNADGTVKTEGSTITVESVKWRKHTDEDYKCALTDNLDDVGEGNDDYHTSEVTDTRSQYEIFLSIDSQTDKKYDLAQPKNAFVAQIPNGNGSTAHGANADGTIKTTSSTTSFSNTESGSPNNPLVGIRLRDTDTDNNRPGFHNNHLNDEDYVVIKIKAVTPVEGGGTEENFYTINLTIDYLRGPYINGTVDVKNCALPGEYIYATTEGMTLDMADNLTVTGKKWFLYPKVKDENSNSYSWDTNQRVDVTKYIDLTATGDVNGLNLPARYYQNDWKLDFKVMVNNQEFGVNNKLFDLPRLVVHNYHRMSTVSREVRRMKLDDSGNVVFGPETGNVYQFPYDLDLVGGALVYIEDDEDFKVFTQYVNYCNTYRTEMPQSTEILSDKAYKLSEHYRVTGGVLEQKDLDATGGEHWAKVLRAEVLPGFNRMGGITGYKNDKTIFGYDDDEDVPMQNVKDPSGAENIRFVLTADVETTEGCLPISEFRGRLIGNGHTIHFKDGYKDKSFIDKNYGQLDYVGFVSSGAKDGKDKNGNPIETAIVNTNVGQVNNCFYYAYKHENSGEPIDYSQVSDAEFMQNDYASLVQEISYELTAGGKRLWVGTVDNCYQNTDQPQANKLQKQVKNLLDTTIPAELSGLVANGTITSAQSDRIMTSLKQRTRSGLRYRPSGNFHNGMIAYNLNQEYLKARWKSHDNDRLVREQMNISKIDENGNYVEGDFLYNYYADGDYRYAYISGTANHPEALRTGTDDDPWPNYNGRLGRISRHLSGEEVGHDLMRWYEVEDNATVTAESPLWRNDIVEIGYNGQIAYEETTDGNGSKVIKAKTVRKGYFPIYLHDADNKLVDHSDFIFFGQRLTLDSEDREYYPHAVNYANRVYRATGTYGSRTDYGFHFNRNVEIVAPRITAIDFNRTLDLKYGPNETPTVEETENFTTEVSPLALDILNQKYAEGAPQYKDRWQFYVRNQKDTEQTGADGKVTQYKKDKYYPYDMQAANFDTDGNYSENLNLVPADSLMALVFYPPLLDLPGGDNPKNLHNLVSFASVNDSGDRNIAPVNSNSDITEHSKVTKNLLVYTPMPAAAGSADEDKTYNLADEQRLFGAFHYTRKNNWGQSYPETDQNDIVGHHLRWVDHSLDQAPSSDPSSDPSSAATPATALGAHFHAYDGLFHLVDGQDFNAPIEFIVTDDVNSEYSTNGRAWMLRQPKAYSSRAASKKVVYGDDGNDTGFRRSRDAWESIVLPFTCNRIVAIDSDNFSEQTSRGHITHFYDKDRTLTDSEGTEYTSYGETHHDYWLRGLVETADDSTDGDDVQALATFARPGKAADKLFDMGQDAGGKDSQMKGDYNYFNASVGDKSWFEVAYGDIGNNNNYLANHNEYKKPMMFNQYHYLTKNAPYIVAYPGEDYYEFDLSGNFYNRMHNTEDACNPQTILYEFTGADDQQDANANFDASTQKVRIPVTDVYEHVRRTVVPGTGITTTHHGTFRYIAGSEVKDNMYVINEKPIERVNVDGTIERIPVGGAFINCNYFGIDEILPFRTYLTVDIPKFGGSTRSADQQADGDAPYYSPIVLITEGTRAIDDIIEEKPEELPSGIRMYVEDNNLIVISDSQLILPLYGISGQVFRRLDVQPGRNVYRGLHKGVYITLGTKFVIKG